MRCFLLILFVFVSSAAFAQAIPSTRVVSNAELFELLRPETRAQIGAISEKELAAYFRQAFSDRFFYDYQRFEERLPHYNRLYQNSKEHQRRALDHLGKYPDSTHWKLPFNYTNGTPVNAYALRHLARQHKMVDIAFQYFNGNQDTGLVRYFVHQMKSLNDALHAGTYEKIEDGNGVYEAFRSGYRVLNWLWIHNMFLNVPAYADQDQLTTIATLLQHGQHLYERNDQFRSGNHQTRGVSALAMLAILFRDFEGTDLWLKRAMRRLGEHLEQEINADGFQFERSVHYHMSDINNYFYVYQLATINGVETDRNWTDKLRGLFDSLVRIAYPDRSAPVLQDDTEIPWAETNDISGAMTLGYLLFADPEFGYFASTKVDDRVYWFLSNSQIDMLENIKQQKPSYGSLSFEDTGYFIMREGWEAEDKMMIISAGLDEKKPDHQHGDMLGIQAMANGNAILPNYQVRYSLSDFAMFKNSIVKNVALADNQLQGKQWTSNKGGSGFGKFRDLPEPNVIAWEVKDEFDFFADKHDGFEHIGVEYSRQVLYVKDEFWIVKDCFQSNDVHEYKQVWQGHYTLENGASLLRASTPDACGHDILQLNPVDSAFTSGKRGKHWSIVSKFGRKNFSFLTIIYPFQGYNNRLDENARALKVNDWKINRSELDKGGQQAISLSDSSQTILYHVKEWSFPELRLESAREADLFIKRQSSQLFIHSISTQSQSLTINKEGINEQASRTLEPGQVWIINL